MTKRDVLKRWGLAVAVLLAAGAGVAAVVPAGKVDSAAAFERLKTLEGTWVAPGPEDKRATSTFELVANGTVLMEHYRNPAMPGGGHIVTAYHLDGSELVLTHYCIAKNQPTLRAERFDPATGEMQFEFVRASSLRRARRPCVRSPPRSRRRAASRSASPQRSSLTRSSPPWALYPSLNSR